jgi:hypothetical protein
VLWRRLVEKKKERVQGVVERKKEERVQGK